MRIRPYEEKDRENVRFACLNSEGPCRLSSRGQHYILTTYCDYYLDNEAINCFVAADEDDRAIGYVICAADFDRFWQTFTSRYVTRFRKTEFRRRACALRSADLQSQLKREYPAHLHIDILPEYQRMGLGSKLIDTLCAHLREKDVPGVMLTVWKSNEKGRRFYEKYGFTYLGEYKGNLAYGIRF